MLYEVITTVTDDNRRSKEQQNCWDKGENDKGDNQFTFQFGAGNTPSAFDKEFEKVTENEKKKQQDKQDVEIDDCQGNNAVRNNFV